jgi:hypothetical protein
MKIQERINLIITICLFSYSNLFSDEVFPIKGDIDVRAFCEDSQFIVQYFNTEAKQNFQDVYTLKGTILKKKIVVTYEKALQRILDGFVDAIPTGDDSPLGPYRTPNAPFTSYYNDSILYVLVGPSIPDKIELPYLEIKEKMDSTKKMELNWCKKSIGFYPEKIRIDSNRIIGVTPLSANDSIYFFQGNISGNGCFKYAPIGILGNERFRTSKIKKDGKNYTILWSNKDGILNFTSWNYKQKNPKTTKLGLKNNGKLKTLDFTNSGTQLFFAWTDLNIQSLPASSTLKTCVQIHINGGEKE